LDYGDKTIGVAVSLNGRTATGVTTLRRKDSAALRSNLKELKAIIANYGATHIVLGYPIYLNGKISHQCALTLGFKERLGRFFKSKPVILWDERLSTRAVTRVFRGKPAKYKQCVDEMAAVYILQGYIDHINNKEAAMAGYGPIDDIGDFETEDEDISFDDTDDDDSIMLVTENGEEIPLQILSSREDEDGMYVLAVESAEGDVAHFKCTPSGEDEVTFELIESGHEDFERVFNLFKDEYEALGIDIEEIDIEEIDIE